MTDRAKASDHPERLRLRRIEMPGRAFRMTLRASFRRPQPSYVRLVRAFWRINPFLVFGTSFFLGILPLLFAVFSPLGNVRYLPPVEGHGSLTCTDAMLAAGECIEKQVGFAYALNWGPVLVILLPFALFFAFTSVQAMQRMFAHMVKQEMFCSFDWQSSDLTRPSRLRSGVLALVRRTWTYFMVAAVISTIVVAAFIVDWYCVVSASLQYGRLLIDVSPQDRPVICRDTAGQEIDWSISAIIPPNNSIRVADKSSFVYLYWNWWFSTYGYFFMMIEVMIFLSYFCFIFALAIVIYEPVHKLVESLESFVIMGWPAPLGAIG